MWVDEGLHAIKPSGGRNNKDEIKTPHTTMGTAHSVGGRGKGSPLASPFLSLPIYNPSTLVGNEVSLSLACLLFLSWQTAAS